MSAAKQGHSALDATAGVRGQLADLPDDEARGAFCVAALAHAEEQLAILEDQADAIAAKAVDIAEQWRVKAAEAVRMRDAAVDERDRWQAELDELAGF